MPLESFTNNIIMAGQSAELMLCMLRPGNSIPPLNNPLYWELLRVGRPAASSSNGGRGVALLPRQPARYSQFTVFAQQ